MMIRSLTEDNRRTSCFIFCNSLAEGSVNGAVAGTRAGTE
jgi:hypothetical protein